MADDPNPQNGGDGTGDPTAEEAAATAAAAAAAAAADGGDAPDGTVLTAKDGPQGAPESYDDFTMPDGMEVNKAMLDAAKPIFKEIGLSQIQAQTLTDMYAKQIQSDAQANSDSYKAQNETWKNEVKADPVIGGDKHEESVAIAVKALDKFGSPGLLKMLDETGIGNHPDVVRFCHKVGLTIAEDDPGGDTKPTTDAKTAAEIMYPDESKEG